MTNRLLFEAVGLHLYERWGDMHLRVNGGSLDEPAQEALLPELISRDRADQQPDLTAPARTTTTRWCRTSSYRAALSYVTGTHAFKVGFNRTHGFLERVPVRR